MHLTYPLDSQNLDLSEQVRMQSLVSLTTSAPRESVYRWCTKGLKSVTRLPVRVRNLSKADK